MEALEPKQPSADERAVVATALDYFEGWFDGDEVRMARALHPDLVKRGAGEELGITTRERMLELTRQGEGRADAADRRLDIEVTGLYGDIARATVRSAPMSRKPTGHDACPIRRPSSVLAAAP